jgi:hypothetical protein
MFGSAPEEQLMQTERVRTRAIRRVGGRRDRSAQGVSEVCGP